MEPYIACHKDNMFYTFKDGTTASILTPVEWDMQNQVLVGKPKKYYVNHKEVTHLAVSENFELTFTPIISD